MVPFQQIQMNFIQSNTYGKGLDWLRFEDESKV